MRIRRLLFVLAVLLMAVTSQVNALMSENSRQGFNPDFPISASGNDLTEPASCTEDQADAPTISRQPSDNWHHGRHFAKVLTPYLYTGRRLDPFSGNYFNRNRYYNPRYGRFITKDPIGFNGGNNLWGYVYNNPLRYTDPFGLTVEELVNLLLERPAQMGHGCIIDSLYDQYIHNPTQANLDSLVSELKLLSGVVTNADLGIAFDDPIFNGKPYSELSKLGVPGFQAHHLLPQYLGEMLEYSTEAMKAHPSIYVTQFAHTGRLNPDAVHKMISKYLPYKKGVTYSADQIRVGLKQAYTDLGKPFLFDLISHLIK